MSITNITKWYHHYHNMYVKACTLYCVCVFAHVATECHSSECQYPGQYRHTLHATQAHTYNTVFIYIYKCIPTCCADTCAQDSWLPSCFNWRFHFSSNWSLSRGASPIYQARFVDRGKISELVRNYGVV